MTNLILALTLNIAAGSTATHEMEYSHGSVGFRLNLTPRELTVEDRTGARAIRRMPCNAALISNYWNELNRRVSRLKSASRSRQLASAASVARHGARLRVDDREHRIGMFDPNLSYFDRVARDTSVLLVAERRACRSHK